MDVRYCKLNKKEREKALKILTKRHSRKVLGEGATSTVYAFDRKRVIRVQCATEDYAAETGYDWAEYCIRSRSKHVPKIDFIGVVRGKYCLTHVVTVLERLEEVDEHEVYGEAADMSGFVEGYLMGEDTSYYGEDASWKALQKHFPRRAAYSMRKTIQKKGLYFNDLHAGNWMLRKKDKRFVITDPIC